MKRKLIKYLKIIPFLFLISCEEAFDYHPYDANITGETDINNKNIKRIEEICANKTTFRFILTGDTQRWYDETEYFVKNVNKRDDIDFVIHGGDFTDFGVTKEFLWQRNILNKLDIPYVGVIGNHDCLGSGKDVYNKVFGDENFSFKAGNVKFICLNTNAFEYDYSNPIPNFDFIKSQTTNNDDIDKSIVVMHARPFSDQFNNNVADFFEQEILKLKNLQFCLNAHSHKLQEDDLFGDGIYYYGCDCIESRSYLVFTIKPEGYSYEVVYF